MPTVIQVAGVGSVIVGAFLIAVPVGFIVGGVLLTLIGVAMERTASAE